MCVLLDSLLQGLLLLTLRCVMHQLIRTISLPQHSSQLNIKAQSL